jgi:hypothetical protein
VQGEAVQSRSEGKQLAALTPQCAGYAPGLAKFQ